MSGYNSDEEVYAAARAAEESQAGLEYDENGYPIVRCGSFTALWKGRRERYVAHMSGWRVG
jgi:hypothetical protein